MILSHSIDSGKDFVELRWIPRFEPERYQLKYVCAPKPTRMPNRDNDYYVITNTRHLNSSTTSSRVSNLPLDSICMFFLLAAYNPASIDTGIAITGTTLDQRTTLDEETSTSGEDSTLMDSG